MNDCSWICLLGMHRQRIYVDSKEDWARKNHFVVDASMHTLLRRELTRLTAASMLPTPAAPDLQAKWRRERSVSPSRSLTLAPLRRTWGRRHGGGRRERSEWVIEGGRNNEGRVTGLTIDRLLWRSSESFSAKFWGFLSVCSAREVWPVPSFLLSEWANLVV